MTRTLLVTAALSAVALLAGCAAGQTPITRALPPLVVAQAKPVGVGLKEVQPQLESSAVTPNSGTIAGLDQYPTMLLLLTASGVLAEIGERPVTILAPSEEAFRNFAFVDTSNLLSNPALMAPILRRHVVLGVYDAAGLAAASSVDTLAGEQLAVSRNGRMVLMNGSTVTLPPPPATPSVSGGVERSSVVYGIDRLIFPGGAA